MAKLNLLILIVGALLLCSCGFDVPILLKPTDDSPVSSLKKLNENLLEEIKKNTQNVKAGSCQEKLYQYLFGADFKTEPKLLDKIPFGKLSKDTYANSASRCPDILSIREEFFRLMPSLSSTRFLRLYQSNPYLQNISAPCKEIFGGTNRISRFRFRLDIENNTFNSTIPRIVLYLADDPTVNADLPAIMQLDVKDRHPKIEQLIADKKLKPVAVMKSQRIDTSSAQLPFEWFREHVQETLDKVMFKSGTSFVLYGDPFQFTLEGEGIDTSLLTPQGSFDAALVSNLGVRIFLNPTDIGCVQELAKGT